MITDTQERKGSPLYSGCLAYFPKALAELQRFLWAPISLPAAETIACYLTHTPSRKQAQVLAINALELLQEELAPGSVLRKPIPEGVHGLLAHFRDALTYVAHVSWVGSQQHNPGKPLFWDRSKSGDELDALARHLLEAGAIDVDGVRHSGKVAWRALANLEKTIEREQDTLAARRSAKIDRVPGTREVSITFELAQDEIDLRPVFLFDGGPVEDG